MVSEASTTNFNLSLASRDLCFLPVLVVIAAACQTLTEVAHFHGKETGL